MWTASPDSVKAVVCGRHAQQHGGRRRALRLLGILCALVLCGAARGDGPEAVEAEAVGRFIPVPPSISGEAIQRIRQTAEIEFTRFKTAEQQRDIAKRRKFKVVYDFNPDGKVNRSDNFGFCLKLAEDIRQLRLKGVLTTAFVHGEVSGHTVLPVLACQQIVMARKAKLGPVLFDDAQPLKQYEQAAYLEFGERFATPPKQNERPAPPALVRKLFERNLVVVPGQQGGFVDAAGPDAVAGARPVFERGSLAVFDFSKARDVNLCELDPRETREEVAVAYRLPRESLQESPLLGTIVAWQIPVTGEVNGALREQLQRRIRRAERGGANLIVLELRCHGGDPSVASNIANDLLKLNQNRADKPVVTVAYVTKDAQDTATTIALGCTSIVMDKEARLGGFERLLKGRPAADLDALGAGMEDLAEQQFYPKALARAFVDSSVEKLFFVTSATGAGEWKVLTGRQYDEERKERPNKWRRPAEVIPLDADGFLTLDAAQAQRFGLASSKANDLASLYEEYGVAESQVKKAGPDWLDDLADFLRNDWTSFLLVMIGITCLILEMKMPGVGLPGIVAAVCFVLYFWSHSQLEGQVTWLAILLFLLGLVLLGIEIFVIPGFGVCGLSGIILVIGSLALVAHGHWPQNSGDWLALSKQVGPIGLCLMGSVVLAVLLARYLPSIPFANRLMLKPQSEVEGYEAEPDPVQAANAALLGAIGVAATPLRPAGKVQFGEQFVDVVAEGSYVVPGTRVQVIEVEGNRIVVKQV